MNLENVPLMSLSIELCSTFRFLSWMIHGHSEERPSMVKLACTGCEDVRAAVFDLI